jgi:hypothetical protein
VADLADSVSMVVPQSPTFYGPALMYFHLMHRQLYSLMVSLKTAPVEKLHTFSVLSLALRKFDLFTKMQSERTEVRWSFASWSSQMRDAQQQL